MGEVLPHARDLFKRWVNLKSCATIFRQDANGCGNALQLEARAKKGRSCAIHQRLHEVLIAFDDGEVQHDLGSLISDDDR